MGILASLLHHLRPLQLFLLFPVPALLFSCTSTHANSHEHSQLSNMRLKMFKRLHSRTEKEAALCEQTDCITSFAVMYTEEEVTETGIQVTLETCKLQKTCQSRCYTSIFSLIMLTVLYLKGE